ncbi:twin-arginine translocation signal domain-containing protein [Agromyces albus]|uniref:Twin-arginine translocation signal domain-containing protein n=2 Tax=Agromyces albus TaxID=205332 RepID=A0A4Q2KS92_9MICO|nr:twin-arginine translocation signal domain-containing protein [Agromyces albus]
MKIETTFTSVAVSRRSVLTLSAVAIASAGLGPLWGTPESAHAAGASDPRMLHTAADLSRMRTQVAAGAQPWTAGWERLVNNRHSSASWTPRPIATVVRGGDGQNYAPFFNDIHAAYQNALRWHVSGDEAHAATASNILNVWSRTLTAVNGNADRFLAVGIYGYQFAVAADLLRGYAGFDLAAAQDLLLRVFYPMNNHFLTVHNGAHISNYWANWDLCNMNAVLAIGILCDRQDLIDQAVTYFKSGGGNGSIGNAVPILHSDGLAQWQESGRDQGHTLMGMGQMGTFCEMAWNQGIDLYGYDDNRFLKAAEYVAKYNLGHDVPFTTYSWQHGVNGAWRSQTVISEAGRGHVRPVWELIYNHYVVRRGLSAPHVAEIAAQVRPEGGGGDYGPNSGGFDQLGFGTLAFSLPAGAPTPEPAPAPTPESAPESAPAPTPTPTTAPPSVPAPAATARPTPTAPPAPIAASTGWKKLLRLGRKDWMSRMLSWGRTRG